MMPENKKAENLEKSRLSALFMASPARFERAAFRLGVHCAVFQVVLRHLLNPPESLLFQWIPGDCFLNSVIRFEVSLE